MAGAEDSGENPFVNIRKELSEGARHINKEQGYNYELKLIEAKKTLIHDIESELAELPPLQMASAGSTVIASRAFAWFCNEGEPLVRIEGALIAIGTNEQIHPNIHFWNSNTREIYRTKGGHKEGVATVVYSPGGTTLASGGNDKTIKLWNVKSGECLRTMEGHKHWVRAVAFSPDGTTLASGSLDRTIKLWNVKSGECLRTQNEHTGTVRSISFSPDGAILASGSSDHTIKLWNVNTGECLRTMEGHSPRWIPEKAMPSGFVMPGHPTQAWVKSICFSPDGATLASGSDDYTIKLWNVNTGECIQTLEGHTYGVDSVAFSPNGANLVSGGDSSFRFWNVNTGKCFLMVKTKIPVNSVAFSPDDRTFSRLDLENIFREVRAMLGEAEFHLSTEDGVKFTVSWDGLK